MVLPRGLPPFTAATLIILMITFISISVIIQNSIAIGHKFEKGLLYGYLLAKMNHHPPMWWYHHGGMDGGGGDEDRARAAAAAAASTAYLIYAKSAANQNSARNSGDNLHKA